MRVSCVLLLALFLASAQSLLAVPAFNVISGQQMRISAGSSITSGGPDVWNVTIQVAYDNNNPIRYDGGTNYRTWWHTEITGLDPNIEETLFIQVTNAAYSDWITPVVSFDDGETYTRIPDADVLGRLSFLVVKPAGVSALRFAKYFPYTRTDYFGLQDALRASSHVLEIESPNSTTLGTRLYLYEITDTTVPSAGKERVWIHSAVHPAENTAHFVMEGLARWLVSGEPEAETLLDHVIFDLVPMANPDGVILGNYYTSATNAVLELQWGAPYTQTNPEIVFMRSKIEEFMGTAASPGANPIKLLLNLHSSHNLTYPFHFIHNPTYFVNGQGVTPSVNALEHQWVAAFRARSPFLALNGSDQSSSLGSRPYVESMMHDRYSVQPQWDDVMAITFEGTYEASPTPGVPNTPEDYYLVGEQMGLAIADFLGIPLTSSVGEGEWMMLY